MKQTTLIDGDTGLPLPSGPVKHKRIEGYDGEHRTVIDPKWKRIYDADLRRFK